MAEEEEEVVVVLMMGFLDCLGDDTGVTLVEEVVPDSSLPSSPCSSVCGSAGEPLRRCCFFSRVLPRLRRLRTFFPPPEPARLRPLLGDTNCSGAELVPVVEGAEPLEDEAEAEEEAEEEEEEEEVLGAYAPTPPAKAEEEEAK